MSDSDSDDLNDELRDIIAEYDTKDKATKTDIGSSVIKQEQDTETKVKKETISNEVPMDKVLFGDKRGLLKNLARSAGQESSDEDSADRGGINSDLDSKTKSKGKKRKPVWTDADDEDIQFGDIKRETRFTGPLDHLRKDKSYKEYLKNRFEKIVQQPSWANLDKKPEENSDDEALLHTVGFLAKPAEDVLRPNQISFKRLSDLNRATYAEGVISRIQFHPTSTAALVAGQSGIATIYSIDGVKNEKLHNMEFHKFPILSARILPCGTKAVFGSKTRYYYRYDLLSAQETWSPIPKFMNTTSKSLEVSPCGRYIVILGRLGEFHVMTASSNELLHTFKQNENAVSLCFTADSEKIICKDDSTNVNIFSMRQRRLQHTFTDDGCIIGNVVALSPNQRMLATGSREGVVNVYDFEKVQNTTAPSPEKSFLNLTTSISDIKFNHTSELLAMCSSQVSSAVRLVHFPSATVYKNFPGVESNIGKVKTIEFSPNSGYFALGNTKEVPFMHLKFFKNY